MSSLFIEQICRNKPGLALTKIRNISFL